MLPSRYRLARLLQLVPISLAGILLCPAFANGQGEPGPEQPRIREIRIDIATVYSEAQAEESSWARFSNRYHIKTRESVIRTELLFNEGDVLDEELLKATERALRRFRFLNKAEVLVVPVDDRTVDVEVRTKDAWSLVLGANIDGGGGLTTISVHLMELNLFGHGKKLFAEAIDESDVGTTWKFGYNDYQIFNSQWVGGARYKTGPLIESFSVNASLPLYSLDSEWSYGGSAYKADQIVRLFEEGEESSRFGKDRVLVSGFVKRSFGERHRKNILKLQLKYNEADYSTLGAATTTPPPPDQANVTPIVGISTGHTKWVKNTYIDKLGITEDDWLGLRYGGNVGYGIPVGDGSELWDTRIFVTKHTALAHEQLLLLDAAVSSEVVQNTIVYGSAKYYKTFSRHTLAMRFMTKLGYELDSSKQFQLGADSGLRGYAARQFTGEKMVLINLEDRQHWGSITWGPEIAVGTVLFVDAGNVWKDEEDISLADLNWSAGIGIRLGFTRLPHQPIFRLDYGWAIGNSSNEATIGIEQHF